MLRSYCYSLFCLLFAAFLRYLHLCRCIFIVLIYVSSYIFILLERNKLQEVDYNFIRRNEEANIDNGNFMKIFRARAITRQIQATRYCLYPPYTEDRTHFYASGQDGDPQRGDQRQQCATWFDRCGENDNFAGHLFV